MLRFSLVVGLALLSPHGAWAEAAPPDAGAPAADALADPSELANELETARAALAALPAEPPAGSPEAARRARVQKRIGLLEQVVETTERAARLRAEAAAPTPDAEAARALAAVLALPPPEAPESPTEAGLEAVRAEARQGVKRLQDLKDEQRALQKRVTELPGLEEQARDRARAAREQVRALSATLTTLPDGPERDRISAELGHAELEARLADATAETLALEARVLRRRLEGFDGRVDLAQQELTRVERLLGLYQDAVQRDLASAKETTAAALLEAEARLEAAATPFARFVAQAEVMQARARAGVAALSGARVAIERDLTQQRKLLAADETELQTLRELVDQAANTERIAEKLKETFQRLDRRHQALDRAQAIPELTRLGEYRARRFEVSDALLELDPRWEEDEDALLASLTEARRPEARKRLTELREEVRAALREEQGVLIELIAEAEQLRNVLVKRGEVLQRTDTLVRARIFWVQDAPPLGLEPLGELPGELRTVARWWRGVSTDELAERMSDAGAWAIVWICLVMGLLPAGLLVLRRWLLGVLEARELFELSPEQGWPARLRIIAAGVVTTLMVPAWFWIAQGAVAMVELPAALGPMLAEALGLMGWVTLLWFASRLLFGPRRMAEFLLGLGEPASRAAHRSVRLWLSAYALLMIPWHLMKGPPLSLHVLPRLAYTAFQVVILVALFLLLRPGSSLVRDSLSKVSPRIARFWPPVATLLLLFGVVVVGMDVAGYRYGAGQLATSAIESVALLVPFTWLWIHLRSALVERLSRPPPETEEDVPDADPREGRRKRAARADRLLRFAYVGVLVLTLAAVWHIDQRALAFLDGVHLYDFSGDSGAYVSVLDVLQALAVVAVTVWLLKVMPRLFGVLLFPYLEPDDGVRYAIVTIARYGTFFLGLLIAFDAVHIDLGKLGWLVAAIGVGLGFGLQEIVSNFVSGIILLVERPIRIGDFLTIGAIEGRVQRINIRATTVMSLDRQEIIVPNKDLITKEVTNWTRGDPIIRMIVKIGVAYGSPIEKVKSILLEAAVAVPQVLRDPPPEILFWAHGDSSLDFQVRVHVADPGARWGVLDKVNAGINRRLHDAGIEIPFPQRDLHIRSGSLEVEMKKVDPE